MTVNNTVDLKTNSNFMYETDKEAKVCPHILRLRLD